MSTFDTVRNRSDKLGPTVAPHAKAAKERAAHYAGGARAWASPRMETATTTVREEVTPRVREALITVATVTGPVRNEARHRAGLAVAALRGADLVEREKPTRRWTKRPLLVLGAGAVAVAVAGVVQKQRHKMDARDVFPPDMTADMTTEPLPVSHRAGGASPSEILDDTAAKNTPPASAADPTGAASRLTDASGLPPRGEGDRIPAPGTEASEEPPANSPEGSVADTRRVGSATMSAERRAKERAEWSEDDPAASGKGNRSRSRSRTRGTR